MDNLAYLNQISADTRKAPRKLSQDLLNPKILKWVGLALAVFLFITLLGGLLGSQRNKEQKLVQQLTIRTTNISTSLQSYNYHIKSSTLRAIANSLSVLLIDTNTKLTGILGEEFDSGAKIPQELTDEETDYTNMLNLELENARLNGQLDRFLVSKLSYETSLILAMESEIVARTKKESLSTYLQNSMTNLQKILDQLANYKDTTI